jgi:ABC-type uncharacterized transport system ATPase subunit
MTELLRVSGVTKRFGGLWANRDVTLELEEASLLALIGPNGAGKSTLLSLISGQQRPTAGDIYYAGRKVTRWPTYRRARQGLLLKFQTPRVFDELTVLENLRIAAYSKIRSHRAAARRAGEVAGQIQLQDLLPRGARTLSHGYRQWLEIGMLLAADGQLLLLDEPTAGMTIEETEATAELLRGLTEALGVSIIAVEHDMDFIRKLGAPVLVLHNGEVVRRGSMAEIEVDPLVRDVYLGKA